MFRSGVSALRRLGVVGETSGKPDIRSERFRATMANTTSDFFLFDIFYFLGGILISSWGGGAEDRPRARPGPIHFLIEMIVLLSKGSAGPGD